MDITKTLKAIVILDADGKRTLSKYFEEKISSRPFERSLFLKTKSHKVKDEILVVDNMLVVHRFVADLHLYVIGGNLENPLVLDSVLNCLAEVVSVMLQNKGLEQRQSVYDHMSQLIIAMDEMCDNGTILETDPNLVMERVSLKADVVEQSYAQRIQMATEHIKFPWIRS